MKLIVKQSRFSKSLDNWSNKDFLIYFSNRLRDLNGQGLDIPPVAWQGFLSRIVGFRNKLKLNNQNYKEYIDKVFDYFTSNPSYTPVFGIIVSEKVFYTVSKYKHLHQNNIVTNEEFIKLRDQLYSNIMLFRKVE